MKDLFDESETKGDGLRYGDVSAHLRAERDEKATPAETINTALCCAEGEAAIEEHEERAARNWLAALVEERDRLRDIARQRDEAEIRAAEAAKALTTLDSILGNTIADDGPENFRLLIAMQQIARAALSAMPAYLLAQREREQAALALLREYRASFQGIGLSGSEQGALERRLFAAVDGLGEETP